MKVWNGSAWDEVGGATKQVASGTYTGNGGTITITIGFRPTLIVVRHSNDDFPVLLVDGVGLSFGSTNKMVVNGLATFTDTQAIIKEGGLYSGSPNGNGTVYTYWAVS